MSVSNTKHRPNNFTTRAGRQISPGKLQKVLFAAFGVALLVLIWFLIFAAALMQEPVK